MGVGEQGRYAGDRGRGVEKERMWVYNALKMIWH